MIDLSSLFVGVGLAISLTFSEFFGLAAGGLVVPGYVAFNMGRPAMVFCTLVVSFMTYLVVRGIAGFTIVYGRRRTVLMILVGYLLGILMRFFMTSVVDNTEFAIIGYIVPGLIAIWMDRQGVIETLATLLTASAITRLAMILVTGGEFLS